VSHVNFIFIFEAAVDIL